MTIIRGYGRTNEIKKNRTTMRNYTSGIGSARTKIYKVGA